jgi:hypothetical protein
MSVPVLALVVVDTSALLDAWLADFLCRKLCNSMVGDIFNYQIGRTSSESSKYRHERRGTWWVFISTPTRLWLLEYGLQP